MSMVCIGRGTYLDTDDLSNEGYAEFCEHRKNLEKYYKYRNNESAKLKAKMLGINIDKVLNDAEKFLHDILWGTDINIHNAMRCIAERVEE